ncbi:MAG: phosphoribosylformylglycinamidine synthase subunit PurS [Candidatus Geothermarchaeales archaeon]
MKYRARVAVYPKPEVTDPEGASVKSYLRDRGYAWVEEVRCGKFWEITVEATSRIEARERVEKVCLDPLANLVKDNYDILGLEEIE